MERRSAERGERREEGKGKELIPMPNGERKEEENEN